MIKLLTLLLLTFLSINAQGLGKIIPPEEAFNATLSQDGDFLFINIDLKDGVYLLDDKFIFETIKGKKINFTNRVQKSFAQIYKEQKVYYDNFKGSYDLKNLNGEVTIKMTYQGCASGGEVCYPPLSKTFTAKIEKPSKLSEHENIASYFTDKNIFLVLAIFFLFGFLLSLTPCVFPMIPILSSIIAKHSKTEQISAKKGLWLSFIYVFFMSIAYAMVGVVAGTFGANMQTAMQNPWTIGIFSAIFIFLALSMFNFYNISLPASFQNKISNIGKSGKNGVLGVAIMGFLSALIVGPCVVAPLAGALIYIGESGDAILGGLALFVMSFGMGAPLLLIGTFAGKFLSKPGHWMNIVQRIFGIVLLFMAIWMLSRILSNEVTNLLIASVLIGCFIFANHFLPKEFFGWKKRVIDMLFLFILFASAALLYTSMVKIFFNDSTFNFQNKNYIQSIDFIKIKNIDELDELVKNSQKPIMLEFFATWCVSCIEFEEKVFSKSDVKEILKDFILAKVDVSKNEDDDKKLLQKFGLFGPPGIIFYKNKKELKHLNIVGFKNKDEFITTLKDVLND